MKALFTSGAPGCARVGCVFIREVRCPVISAGITFAADTTQPAGAAGCALLVRNALVCTCSGALYSSPSQSPSPPPPPSPPSLPHPTPAPRSSSSPRHARVAGTEAAQAVASASVCASSASVCASSSPSHARVAGARAFRSVTLVNTLGRAPLGLSPTSATKPFKSLAYAAGKLPPRPPGKAPPLTAPVCKAPPPNADKAPVPTAWA
jgi:hypothetical protein